MARKITVEEIFKIIREEFGAPQDPAKMKVKSKPFDRADIANEVEWTKALKLKEVFFIDEAESMTKLLPTTPKQLPKVVVSKNGNPDLSKLSLDDVEKMFNNKKINQAQYNQYLHYWQKNNPYTDQQVCHCPECTKKFNQPFVDPHADEE